MSIIKTFTPAAALLALALVPMPANAQRRVPPGGAERGGQASERGRAQQAPRNDGGSAPRSSAAQAPRYSAPPAQYSAPRQQAAPRQQYSAPGQYSAPRQYAAPRGQYSAPRGQYAAPRGQYSAPQPGARYGYATPRPNYNYGPAYGYGPSHGYRPSYGYRPYYGGGYGHYRFDRPYYAFRPYSSIGFGLWLGFGVPYPYAYIGSYAPPVYGYYGGRFSVVPNARTYGGISFDIAPADAQVYVDGEYVGIASDYGPYAAPFTLVPGAHRVVVSVGGYQPISWNVSVVAGQVIPIRGTIEGY